MAETEQSREERRKAIGAVIRNARGEMTQSELGVKLGDVPQTTISRWEKGIVDLTLEQTRDLERALGLQHGTIFIAAGYVDPKEINADTETVLRADPTIAAEFREDLLRNYRTYQSASKKMDAAAGRTRVRR